MIVRWWSGLAPARVPRPGWRRERSAAAR